MQKRELEDTELQPVPKKLKVNLDPLSSINAYYVQELIFQHIQGSVVPLLEVSKSWNEILSQSTSAMQNIKITVNSQNYEEIEASNRKYQKIIFRNDIGEYNQIALIQKFSKEIKMLKIDGQGSSGLNFEKPGDLLLPKIKELTIQNYKGNFIESVIESSNSSISKLFLASCQVSQDFLTQHLARFDNLTELFIYNTCDSFLPRIGEFGSFNLKSFGFSGVITPQALQNLKTFLLKHRETLEHLSLHPYNEYEDGFIPPAQFVMVYHGLFSVIRFRIRIELSDMSTEIFKFIVHNLPNLQVLRFNDDSGDACEGVADLYQEMLENDEQDGPPMNENLDIEEFCICFHCLHDDDDE